MSDLSDSLTVTHLSFFNLQFCSSMESADGIKYLRFWIRFHHVIGIFLNLQGSDTPGSQSSSSFWPQWVNPRGVSNPGKLVYQLAHFCNVFSPRGGKKCVYVQIKSAKTWLPGVWYLGKSISLIDDSVYYLLKSYLVFFLLLLCYPCFHGRKYGEWILDCKE